eukprot:TRINITY_DN19573_c1_g1_i1.p1 TRINITY_DN19573_c1_g1~~TRINITY_DN19573_c1_g1_i1.p1  ORF type:complete len:193 (-),score=34.66 TRINITY_DN19573_c1_g1_i1:11-589(-)
MTAAKQAQLMEIVCKWFIAEAKRETLIPLAAQVVGFFAEVIGQGFEKYIDQVFPHLANIIKTAATTLKEQETTGEVTAQSEEKKEDWQVTYYGLIALEKIIKVLSARAEVRMRETQLFDALVSLLLHPHSWIRSGTSRVIGLYFSTLKPQSFGDSAYVDSTLLRTQQNMFNLEIGRAVQQECRDRSRMPSSA